MRKAKSCFSVASASVLEVLLALGTSLVAFGGPLAKVLFVPHPKPNNTLQGTFDPLPIFAAAKTGIASNAPERGRYVS